MDHLRGSIQETPDPIPKVSDQNLRQLKPTPLPQSLSLVPDVPTVKKPVSGGEDTELLDKDPLGTESEDDMGMLPPSEPAVFWLPQRLQPAEMHHAKAMLPSPVHTTGCYTFSL
ncbi:hypothetical protein scyTo_0019780 [Scyliorhinus torazame]|uniref:Uncharacterized protein n=1 Tax=Scyliorhinus torazame TaxID=75743 RepID=A0A401PQZ8_SCYTO|nr:hypothetical protein [Scyliorhinus torazame]